MNRSILYFSFILCLIILNIVVCNSSLAGLIDQDVHPRPANPPNFDSSHKAIDPVFGSAIVRVTGPPGSNAVYESGETQNLAPIQHFHNPWSFTGDHFLVWADRTSTGGGARVDLYSINRENFTVTRIRAVGSPVSKMNYNRGVHFDHDNEWIVYSADTYSSPDCIRRWNLHTSESQEGLAAQSDEVLYSDTEGVHQMTQSNDDDRFCYYTDNHKVKLWIRSTGSLYSLDCGGWYSFDEAQISDDGKYVFVKGKKISGTSIGAYCYSYDFSQEWDYGKYSPDYFAGKHSGYGNKWVNECAQLGYRLVMRVLDNDKPGENPWSGTPVWTFICPTGYNCGGVHPSYSNSNYVYGGFFRAAGHPSPWVAYHDEVCRFKDDGAEVLRLCHAWSNFYSSSYDEIPTYASPAGDYVIFYSNWNGQSSSARHDVFIVRFGPPAPQNLKIINP